MKTNIAADTRLRLQEIGYNPDGKKLADVLNYLYEQHKVNITTYTYKDGKFAYIIEVDGVEKQIGSRSATPESALNCGIRVACEEFIEVQH